MNPQASSAPSSGTMGASARPEAFGRYLLYPAIASGGMATVHPARLVGAEGFSRLVAAKRLHPQLTDDPDFVTMFHDEACIASRIHHPNVVPVLDIVTSGTELILVQEYVHGVPLSQLLRVAHGDGAPIPIEITVAVLTGMLAGLHAAHEVKDENDRPLEIVHRDVSPANVMVSVDGMPRLLDFGIAKARTSTHHTREGIFKGKLAYMAPEQLRMDPIGRTLDVYAAGVVAWEMLVNRRIYDGRHEIAFVTAVVNGELPCITEALEATRDAIGETRWAAIEALAPIVSRAMSPSPEDRFQTAADMLHALVECATPSSTLAVAEWVRAKGAEFLDLRQKALAATEESSRRTKIFVPSEPQMASSLAPTHLPSMTIPHAVSGSYPVTRLSTEPRIVDRGRALLPWIGATSFMGALFVVFALRAHPEGATAVATNPGPGVPPLAASVLPPSSPSSSPSSSSPSSSSTSSAPPAAQTAAPIVVARPVHPAPVYWAPLPPRPAPLAPPPRASSPSSASAADCNPPFFFEGTKKVFKPSCL